jgi:hypothetical protein
MLFDFLPLLGSYLLSDAAQHAATLNSKMS